MRCPDMEILTQSYRKGEKRTQKAANELGIDVMNRIYSFVLYSLGYSYEHIAKHSTSSKPGIKRVINEVLKNGVDGFLDKRKTSTAKQSVRSTKKRVGQENIVECEEYTPGHLELRLSGNFNIKIKKDDIFSTRILTLLLYDSGFIDQQKAADILGCHRNTVSLNLERLRSGGAKALLDGRIGQQNDYKFNNEVKAEIVNAFLQDVLEGDIPSKTSIRKRLNKKFLEEYSASAVAFHLKRIGVSEYKEDLIKNISMQINKKIDSLEYLDPYHDHPIQSVHIAPMKNIRDNLKSLSVNAPKHNLFDLESKIENIQSNLQPVVIESLIREMVDEFDCPFCQSRNIGVNSKNGRDRVVKTSLGGEWNLSENMFMNGKCKDCHREFDILSDLLMLPEYSNFTPLTQKKICSANIAKSYDGAVLDLKQQIGLDINKKQVRNISTRVGGYIDVEFKQIYKEIKEGLSRTEIAKRHPLINQIEIDKKYLDKSKYLITVAVDGGRMQLFNWIPPNKKDYEKARKKTYWHENKVFRISIYDKDALEDFTDSIDGVNMTQKYQCAKIVPELSTYAATNLSWKESAPLILSHLYARGIDTNDVQLCLSDGSDHILQGIFIPLFPNSIHILDYYHKSEALHSCLKSIDFNDKEINGNQLKKYLWDGQIEKLVDDLKKIQIQVGFPEKGKRKPDNPKVKLDNFINHMSENKKRLRYKKFRDLKYPIGSGSVESAVKMFGKRIKGTEKQWNEEGGESILHLYAFLLSKDDRWNKLWDYQAPWTYK